MRKNYYSCMRNHLEKTRIARDSNMSPTEKLQMQREMLIEQYQEQQFFDQMCDEVYKRILVTISADKGIADITDLLKQLENLKK